MHAEGTRPFRDPDGTRPSTPSPPNVLTAVAATSALDARRWHLPSGRKGRLAGEGGVLLHVHSENGEATHAWKAISAHTDMRCVHLFVWLIYVLTGLVP